MTPLPIKPAPEWAAAVAAGRIRVEDVPDRALVFVDRHGVAFVSDGNPPPTLVPLDAVLWSRTCRSCGWPLTASTGDAHATCDRSSDRNMPGNGPGFDSPARTHRGGART